MQDGAPVLMILETRDISDEKRVQQEQAHLMSQLEEAHRRKDEFLAMLAHELRNPLAPIASAADLLGAGYLDAAAARRASEVIARQVRHMTGLVDDLLDVSRVTRGLITLDADRLDVKRIVAEAVEQVRPLIEARGHWLSVHTPAEAATVAGDRKRLVQVVTNLLVNAAKFTPQGGEIDLRIGVEAGRVNIEVADNGIGMCDALIKRAFDLFAQAERDADRSQGGLGIGLALAKRLVELHGGSIRAASEGQGKGSCFTVCLPQAAGVAVAASESALAAQPAGRARKIMLVDDNVDAAQMLAIVLRTMGHVVDVAHSAKRALEEAQRNVPDAFLLDIGLPDMDGHELARRLRAHPATAHATLVAITGYGQERDRVAAVDAGFDHHFVKPVDSARLAALLQELGER